MIFECYMYLFIPAGFHVKMESQIFLLNIDRMRNLPMLTIICLLKMNFYKSTSISRIQFTISRIEIHRFTSYLRSKLLK